MLQCVTKSSLHKDNNNRWQKWLQSTYAFLPWPVRKTGFPGVFIRDTKHETFSDVKMKCGKRAYKGGRFCRSHALSESLSVCLSVSVSLSFWVCLSLPLSMSLPPPPFPLLYAPWPLNWYITHLITVCIIFIMSAVDLLVRIGRTTLHHLVD